jgi:hypothetical protein
MTGVPILANVFLFLFYLCASYVPSILIALVFSKTTDPNPSSGFVFAQADIIDFKLILEMVKTLDKKVSAGNGGGDAPSSNQESNKKLIELLEE